MAKTILDFDRNTDTDRKYYCHDCDWYKFHWNEACAMCHRFGIEVDGKDPICSEFTTLLVLDPEDASFIINHQKVC